MVTVVKVPRFLALMKNYASKPTITKWIKTTGDTVEEKEPLLVVESTKATLEIESPARGILFPVKKWMDRVKIGDTVAVIADSKEEFQSYQETIVE